MSNRYHEWLKLLRKNEQQWQAFTKPGNTVVIAGPGSGKTRVLAMKIAQLLRDEIAPPQGVACVTYTRMMARELEKRIYSLGVHERPNVVVGTLHSFCLGHVVQPFAKLYQLGLPDPIRIAPQSIWDECLDQARRTVTGTPFDPLRDRRYKAALIKYHRQRIDIPYFEWEDQTHAEVLSWHYDALNRRGFIDFDLVVKAALNLISNNELVRQSLHARFAWLAVDEYQDLGYPLFRIVTEIVDNTPTKLFAIGDPDQSIFDFAGTDPRFLIELALRDDMKPVVMLNKNYRSSKQVISICQAIVQPYSDYDSDNVDDPGVHCRVCELGRAMRDGRTMVRRLGPIIGRLIDIYTARGIPIHEIAVLHRYRESGILRVAQALAAADIPYTLDKHPLYDRSKALITWLEMLAYWCLTGWDFEVTDYRRDSNYEDLMREWEAIKSGRIQGVDPSTEDRILLTKVLWELRGQNILLRDWLDALRVQLSFDETLAKYSLVFPDDIDEFNKLLQLTAESGELSDWTLADFAYLSPGVQLTTLHSSKGMEFAAVIIVGIENIRNNENDKRLLYVGATRAKYELGLLYEKVRPGYAPPLPEHIARIIQNCRGFEHFDHFPL